jgi:hypothetical protein
LKIPGRPVFFERFIESKSIPFVRLPIVPNESECSGHSRLNYFRNFRAHSLTLA